ncbi:hypothetical protein [Nocardia sp. NPDC003963]
MGTAESEVRDEMSSDDELMADLAAAQPGPSDAQESATWGTIQRAVLDGVSFHPENAVACARACADFIERMQGLRALSIDSANIRPISNLMSGRDFATSLSGKLGGESLSGEPTGGLASSIDAHIDVLRSLLDTFVDAGLAYARTEDESAGMLRARESLGGITTPRSAGENWWVGAAEGTDRWPSTTPIWHPEGLDDSPMASLHNRTRTMAEEYSPPTSLPGSYFAATDEYELRYNPDRGGFDIREIDPGDGQVPGIELRHYDGIEADLLGPLPTTLSNPESIGGLETGLQGGGNAGERRLSELANPIPFEFEGRLVTIEAPEELFFEDLYNLGERIRIEGSAQHIADKSGIVRWMAYEVSRSLGEFDAVLDHNSQDGWEGIGADSVREARVAYRRDVHALEAGILAFHQNLRFTALWLDRTQRMMPPVQDNPANDYTAVSYFTPTFSSDGSSAMEYFRDDTPAYRELYRYTYHDGLEQSAAYLPKFPKPQYRPAGGGFDDDRGGSGGGTGGSGAGIEHSTPGAGLGGLSSTAGLGGAGALPATTGLGGFSHTVDPGSLAGDLPSGGASSATPESENGAGEPQPVEGMGHGAGLDQLSQAMQGLSGMTQAANAAQQAMNSAVPRPGDLPKLGDLPGTPGGPGTDVGGPRGAGLPAGAGSSPALGRIGAPQGSSFPRANTANPVSLAPGRASITPGMPMAAGPAGPPGAAGQGPQAQSERKRPKGLDSVDHLVDETPEPLTVRPVIERR